MSRADDLLCYLFEQRPPDAALATWLKTSKAFLTFAERYKAKIRKKIRTAVNAPRYEDLLCELKVVYWLMQDKRFIVEYEKYGLGKQRTADFTVTFRANIVFNLEVTHLRKSIETPLMDRLTNILADKVGQTQPGFINMILIIADEAINDDLLRASIKQLKQMADQKHELFFVRRGYKNATEFLKRLPQLSGVFADGLWLNPSAKFPLHPELVTYFLRTGSPFT